MKYLLPCRYGITGFPTLKFFPKNIKAGEDYNGGRDVDDFVTFINEKCGTNRDAKGKLTSKVCDRITDVTMFTFVCDTDLLYILPRLASLRTLEAW